MQRKQIEDYIASLRSGASIEITPAEPAKAPVSPAITEPVNPFAPEK